LLRRALYEPNNAAFRSIRRARHRRGRGPRRLATIPERPKDASAVTRIG
jgi:hypothetical protein